MPPTTKVLHLSAGNLFGGVETFLTVLAEYQHAANLEHHFALCFQGRLSSELEKLGCDVHQVGRVRISRPWTVVAARRAFSKLLAREKFDVVLTHLAWPHAIFAKIARRAGLPVIFYAHNPMLNPGWLDRWAARTVPDHLIGCSRHTTRSYKSTFPTVPATAIYYPAKRIAVPALSESSGTIRRSMKTADDAIVIIQVSRVERWKGHDQLLNALALRKTKRPWTCWIVGGAQRPAEQKFLNELMAMRDRLHLADRVQFLGERSDVPSLLAAADLFCQANRRSEGLGIVFMEAFAAKLPVVTMRLGPAEEIVAPGCGVLVEPLDVPSLARTLDDLIDDPERRRQFGAAGNAHVSMISNPSARLNDLAIAIEQACAANRLRSVPQREK